MNLEVLNEGAKRVFAQCIPNYQTECIEWTGNWLSHNGYGRMTLYGKKMLTHRVVYMARKGEIPEEMQVMHGCDNRRCVNPVHLSLGTGQDNTNDRKAKDRLGFKLSEEQAIDVKRLYESGSFTQEGLANMFGVRQSLISRIVNGVRWGHLNGGAESPKNSSADFAA
jgi:hypothetical protein